METQVDVKPQAAAAPATGGVSSAPPEPTFESDLKDWIEPKAQAAEGDVKPAAESSDVATETETEAAEAVAESTNETKPEPEGEVQPEPAHGRDANSRIREFVAKSRRTEAENVELKAKLADKEQKLLRPTAPQPKPEGQPEPVKVEPPPPAPPVAKTPEENPAYWQAKYSDLVNRRNAGDSSVTDYDINATIEKYQEAKIIQAVDARLGAEMQRRQAEAAMQAAAAERQRVVKRITALESRDPRFGLVDENWQPLQTPFVAEVRSRVAEMGRNVSDMEYIGIAHEVANEVLMGQLKLQAETTKQVQLQNKATKAAIGMATPNRAEMKPKTAGDSAQELYAKAAKGDPAAIEKTLEMELASWQ